MVWDRLSTSYAQRITSRQALSWLSPNALRNLDAFGVFERIKTKGYRFHDLTFRNNEHVLLDAYEIGNADKYGYDCYRFYRRVVLDVMNAMMEEAGMEVCTSASSRTSSRRQTTALPSPLRTASSRRPIC